jgi:ABC-2 type transport system ATP-binding protein
MDVAATHERTDPDDAKTPTPALKVANVSHYYGARKALDDVTFQVAPASFTVLIGLNGAGKSTLFSLVTRLYATRSGRIEIYGADMARAPRRALAKLGVVFQSRALDLDITVEQNLIYHAALHGIGRAEARERAKAALARADLSDRLGEKVGKLSGGQVRRVEIARALMHQPRLLLLDEPTVGLDVRARAAIVERVRALAREDGVGVLWATHLIDEVEPGDQVVVLHRGRVLARGSIESIITERGVKNLAAAFADLIGADENGVLA